MKDEKIKKYGAQAMNDEIDKMVAKNIKFVKVVIKSKGQVGKRAVKARSADALESFSDTFPAKGLHLNVGIGNYIEGIVKYKYTMKTIEIKNKNKRNY